MAELFRLVKHYHLPRYIDLTSNISNTDAQAAPQGAARGGSHGRLRGRVCSQKIVGETGWCPASDIWLIYG